MKDEPAFPTTVRVPGDPTAKDPFSQRAMPIDVPFPGLTKREIFAMYAMQGLISNHGLQIRKGQDNNAGICAVSVSMADALIAELEKK